MIAFHGDSFVPPELCRLLYLSVPEEFHVAVAFHNRPTSYVTRGALATCRGDQIHVNLNEVCNSAFRQGIPGAPTVRARRTLLDTCYHEFGHVATLDECEAVGDAYMSGRGHSYLEGLADDWCDQRIAMLLEHDGRLAQPRSLTGYLGLRVARLVGGWHDGLTGHRQGVQVASGAGASLVSEVRCRRTGGQLSAGDVLASLYISPWADINAYEVLRRASADVGIDYLDAAGRHHKLYTWGDLPLLQRRLDRQLLRRICFEAREFRIGVFSDLDGLKRKLLICVICARRELPRPTLFGDLRRRRHLTETEVERYGLVLRAHSREHLDSGADAEY